uniref:Uncharacterized protein n=1 Tax=Leersia perrieri TaxID=77586 RepID=A0A0D9V8T1_9ORYZ
MAATRGGRRRRLWSSSSFSCPPPFLVMLVIISCLLVAPSLAVDTVAVDRPLSGGQVLVSKGGKFALGFFQPVEP